MVGAGTVVIHVKLPNLNMLLSDDMLEQQACIYRVCAKLSIGSLVIVKGTWSKRISVTLTKKFAGSLHFQVNDIWNC
jgi:hypothetical protein